MTTIDDLKSRIYRSFGGDPAANSRTFLARRSALVRGLESGARGLDRYEEMLAQSTVSYTTELADKRRYAKEYPPAARELMSTTKTGILKKSGIFAGIVLLCVILFAVFAPIATGTRLTVAGIGSGVLLLAIGLNALWSWISFMKYLNFDYLFKLPDTDFVSTDEQDEYVARRRSEDSALIERLTVIQSESREAIREFDDRKTTQLYVMNDDAKNALLAWESAKDDEAETVADIYVPETVELIDAEWFRRVREQYPGISKSCKLELQNLELMVKTVSDLQGSKTASPTVSKTPETALALTQLRRSL